MIYKKTCSGFPSQWEIKIGKYWYYIRFRFDQFTIGKSKYLKRAIDRIDYYKYICFKKKSFLWFNVPCRFCGEMSTFIMLKYFIDYLINGN